MTVLGLTALFVPVFLFYALGITPVLAGIIIAAWAHVTFLRTQPQQNQHPDFIFSTIKPAAITSTAQPSAESLAFSLAFQ